MLHHSPHWTRLESFALNLRTQRLAKLFAAEPHRLQLWARTACGIELNFSHQLLNSATVDQLLDLAESQKLQERFEAMFRGDFINTTEQRAVLHTALRDPTSTPIMNHDIDVKILIHDALEQMESTAERFADITDVVNLGVGGSDLGTQVVTHSLSSLEHPRCRTHFLSDTDPMLFEQTFRFLDPESTLIVISSKSFTTHETMQNAVKAKRWSQNPQNILAVTAHPQRAKAFGVLAQNILPLWDWVGGRYSVWSSIGFPIIMAHGMSAFRELLRGAHAMDQHVKTADFPDNLPVLLALIGLWNINFLSAQSLGVIPYPYGLRSFPFYIQQLDMESNGKIFTPEGQRLPYATAPIIWGTTGLHAQHSYFQALYQGGHPVPVDFITDHKTPIAHSSSLAALTNPEFFTDTPHNILTLETLSPYHLGALMALYEHKIAAQGFLWGINSFDQPGIELGKRLVEQTLKAPQLTP